MPRACRDARRQGTGLGRKALGRVQEENAGIVRFVEMDMNIQKTNNLPESDPRHHALNISRVLKDLAHHAREDVQKVEDRTGRGSFEPTAENLLGLSNAIDDFPTHPEA